MDDVSRSLNVKNISSLKNGILDLNACPLMTQSAGSKNKQQEMQCQGLLWNEVS